MCAHFCYKMVHRGISPGVEYSHRKRLKGVHTPAVVHSLLPCKKIGSVALHDDVITWKRFPHYWTFVRIHQSTMNYRHKGPSIAGLRCFIRCFSALLRSWINSRLPVIWDAITLMWRHSHAEDSAVIYKLGRIYIGLSSGISMHRSSRYVVVWCSSEIN